ncbi:DNA/RNA polymerase [Rhodotorula sp. JG-1b]|nr:DNA/RNA polymerase [Rhodotorula sp. JG-1b]
MGRRAEIQRFRHRCSLRTGTSSVQATEAQRECPSSVFFFFFFWAFRRTFAHRPLSLSPRNPLRVIAHIDIDAAYAAMEMARLKIPADQPMAVQQWNGLIAVNYPARAYGITRHETPAEALKKCPDLMLVHVQTYKNGEVVPGYWEGAKPETHKVSLDMYRKESKKILAVFQEFCPLVEKASIDESFLDLTLPVRERLLAAYPALATPPPSNNNNLDTPLPPPSAFGITRDAIKWDELGNEQASTSTSTSPEPLDDDPPLTWSDICLSLGAAIVRDTRAAVTERLGYTCSAGIATNKMLAKLTSAWKKPNAQTILRYGAIPAFLRPMPFQKIRNLGGKLGTAVKETYEANTVGDLLDYPLPELKSKLGDASGMWLWEMVRGLDYAEVDPKTAVKSMLSSKNFRPYIDKYGEVMHWMGILATELHLRLNDAREETPGLWPKTITFTHRSPSFVIRSHQAPFPFTSNLTRAYILKAGEKLFRTAIGAGLSTERITDRTTVGPYSNLQLSFSGLGKLENGQRGIEGFFASAAAASSAGGPPVATNGARERVKSESLILSSSSDENEDDATSALPRFRCPRCSKVLTVPEEVRRATEGGEMQADKADEVLEREKAEHADWHVARDLLVKAQQAAKAAAAAKKKAAAKKPKAEDKVESVGADVKKKAGKAAKEVKKQVVKPAAKKVAKAAGVDTKPTKATATKAKKADTAATKAKKATTTAATKGKKTKSSTSKAVSASKPAPPKKRAPPKARGTTAPPSKKADKPKKEESAAAVTPYKVGDIVEDVTLQNGACRFFPYPERVTVSVC